MCSGRFALISPRCRRAPGIYRNVRFDSRGTLRYGMGRAGHSAVRGGARNNQLLVVEIVAFATCAEWAGWRGHVEAEC